jgi:hypothetical protein
MLQTRQSAVVCSVSSTLCNKNEYWTLRVDTQTARGGFHVILESLESLFKYDRDSLCVNKSQFVPVIFEPPCTIFFFLLVSYSLVYNIYEMMFLLCVCVCVCCCIGGGGVELGRINVKEQDGKDLVSRGCDIISTGKYVATFRNVLDHHEHKNTETLTMFH